MDQITNSENQNIQIPVLSPVPTPSNNIFKILTFIFLGLFLIILLFLIYFLIKLNKSIQTPQPQNQVTENIVTSPTATSVPTITSTPDPTVNWKTYTNSTYKFFIKYPSIWSLKPQASFYPNETSFKTTEANCPIDIFCFNSLIDYQNKLNQNSHLNEIIKYSNLSDYLTNPPTTYDWKFEGQNIINNQTYYKVSEPGEGGYSDSVFIENNQNKSFCRIDSCPDKSPYSDLLINSFKFN